MTDKNHHWPLTNFGHWLTRYDNSLILLKDLCEKQWHEELRTDDKADFLLHTTFSQHTTTNVFVGKIRLQVE